MDSSIQLQKQVKDNAEELRNYLSDLNNWAGEMKNLSSGNGSNGAGITIPPVRNVSKKRESNDGGKDAGSKVSKRISSFDYDQWDKFDVDKACEEIDKVEKGEKNLKNDLRACDEAQYEKERGNRFVKSNKWDDAIICYSKAIKCYPKDATFYANRALCYLKKKQYRSVEADCTVALQLEPQYVKALQRRATARRELNQLDDALKDLDKALSLEPDNTALKADLTLVKQKLTTNDVPPSKINQVKDPLKWVPPDKTDGKSGSSPTVALTSRSAKKSDPVDIPSKPVVIEPAKKHQKSEQLIIGEDEESNFGTSSVPKLKPTKKTVDDPPETPDGLSSIQWFTKEGSTVVEPITKPPHRRSKAPLQRVLIKECPNFNLKADIESSRVNNEQEKTRQSAKIDEPIKSEEIAITRNKTRTEVCLKEVYKSGNDLPVPRTSVQFIATWKLIENKPQLCFEFLKKISASSLHTIFLECLESDILSGIIRVLEGEFVKENVPVYDYLEGLCKVRRFSMLAMFLSAADKKGLQKLFDYCVTKEGRTEESVNTLKELYEM